MRAPFTLSQFCPGGISHSSKSTSLPGIAKELLPAGALRSNVVGTLRFPHKRPLPEMQCGGLVIGSVCAAAFFHRGIIPLLTLFFPPPAHKKQLSPP